MEKTFLSFGSTNFEKKNQRFSNSWETRTFFFQFFQWIITKYFAYFKYHISFLLHKSAVFWCLIISCGKQHYAEENFIRLNHYYTQFVQKWNWITCGNHFISKHQLIVTNIHYDRLYTLPIADGTSVHLNRNAIELATENKEVSISVRVQIHKYVY